MRTKAKEEKKKEKWQMPHNYDESAYHYGFLSRTTPLNFAVQPNVLHNMTNDLKPHFISVYIFI